MARERAKQRPPIPHTFQALSTDLNKYDWIKDFYKGSVTAQDGSMAAIFSSDVLIDALKTTTEMFVDGTFSVRCFFLKKFFIFECINILYFLIFSK